VPEVNGFPGTEFDDGADINIIRSDFFATLGIESRPSKQWIEWPDGRIVSARAECTLVFHPANRAPKASIFAILDQHVGPVRIGTADCHHFGFPKYLNSVGGIGLFGGSTGRSETTEDPSPDVTAIEDREKAKRAKENAEALAEAEKQKESEKHKKSLQREIDRRKRERVGSPNKAGSSSGSGRR
jgi:hypothetical protein